MTQIDPKAIKEPYTIQLMDDGAFDVYKIIQLFFNTLCVFQLKY